MTNLGQKIISGLLITTLVASPVYAVDLNTKIKNTDRSTFNTNPGVNINNKPSMFLEFNLSGNALVVRNKTTGKIEPLVSNLMGLDLGGTYGLTSWLQLGALLPLEMPQGTEGSSSYLLGPYFEAKIKLHDNIALVPSYQLSSSSKINVKINNQLTEVPMGSPSGTYGAKVVYQKGNVMEDWGIAAQVGYYNSPDNKYQSIDQSSRILVGASAGMPLSDGLNAAVEVFGEKMDGAFPVEILGLVNIKGETINWQIGAGSGNIQGSGSNTYKAFVGLTYYFGGETSSARGLPTLRPRPSSPSRSLPSMPSAPAQPLMEDNMDEQQGPDVMDPEEGKAPAIPDVNRNSWERYPGRNLASVEENKEVKQEEKAVKKPYMVTLPNGQKLKVFPKEITELPKDTKVQYVTEAGYKKMLQDLKDAEKKSKDLVVQNSVPPTPIVLEEVKIEAEKMTELPKEESVKKEAAIIEPVKVEVVEKTVEEASPAVAAPLKAAPLEATPLVATPKVKEAADPVPMMAEHPPVTLQVVEKTTEDKEIVVEPVDLDALAKEQNKAAVAPVAKEEEKQDNQIPKVSISVEQREELKKQLTEEFNSITVENTSLKMEEKIRAEQVKINEEMAKKTKAAEEEKLRIETEEKAKVAAEEEKNFKENSPLSENKDAAPGKAATDDELKPVRVDRKNKKHVVIQLPEQRLNAFISGEKLPRLQPPTTPEGVEKTSNMLEEDTGVEEANGPSYGFGDEE